MWSDFHTITLQISGHLTVKQATEAAKSRELPLIKHTYVIRLWQNAVVLQLRPISRILWQQTWLIFLHKDCKIFSKSFCLYVMMSFAILLKFYVMSFVFMFTHDRHHLPGPVQSVWHCPTHHTCLQIGDTHLTNGPLSR